MAVMIINFKNAYVVYYGGAIVRNIIASCQILNFAVQLNSNKYIILHVIHVNAV